jgi:hypothetical protein
MEPSLSRKIFMMAETWNEWFGDAKTIPSDDCIFSMSTSRE